MSNISIAIIIRFFVLFDSGLVVKRRMNKESSRMSRAQEKEMDQDRMVEDGNLNRMEEVQIEHDGDRMTLMDLTSGRISAPPRISTDPEHRFLIRIN